MERVSKSQFANGIAWKTLNLFFSRGLNSVISIMLARELEPEHFGLMTIWATILAFGNVIVVGGIDTVLIQQKDVAQEDWSTAKFMCLGRAAFLFALLFFAAPFLGAFYASQALVFLLRIAGLDFFAQAFISINTAKVSRKMDFKRMFFADLAATLVGAIGSFVSLWMGISGWALLVNTVLHRIAYSIFLIVDMQERSQTIFIRERARFLTKQGYNAMANGLFDLLAGSVVGLFSGKKWVSTEVGYMNRAEKLPKMAGVEVYNIVSNLLLPTFSSYQSEEAKLKSIARRLMALTGYIMFPLLLGLAFCSEDLVVLLYTDKWLPAVPLIQISCVYYAVNPIRQLCMQMNYSRGMYKRNTQIELCRTILTMFAILVLCFMKHPPVWSISVSTSLIAVITAINYLLSLKAAIGYNFSEELQDLLPSLVLSAVAMIPVYLLKTLMLPSLLFLVVAIPSAIIVYVGFSLILKLDTFCYVICSLSSLISRRGVHGN